MICRIGIVIGGTRTKLEICADQCLLCDKPLIVNDFNRTVNIKGYHLRKYVAQILRTISGVSFNDAPWTGRTAILLVYQAIESKGLTHIFLLMMHLWMNYVQVNDTNVID